MGNISCRGAIDKVLTLPNDGLGFDSQQKKPLFIFFFFLVVLFCFLIFAFFCFRYFYFLTDLASYHFQNN